MVVFPFVPVTPASSSSFVGSPKKASAATAIDSRLDGTSELRYVDVEHPLDDERDRAALDRLPGEVVPVDALAADAEEERASGRRRACRMRDRRSSTGRPPTTSLGASTRIRASRSTRRG